MLWKLFFFLIKYTESKTKKYLTCYYIVIYYYDMSIK